MSAKAYRDKKAFPFVEKLKEVVKSLTIKCVQLAEQVQSIVERVKAIEQAERATKRPKRAFDMS